MFKVLVVVTIASVVAAFPHHGHHNHDDLSSHIKYKFDYGVKDSHSKDHKSQWEHGDGSNVKGGYVLDEPDGTKRIVEYQSDKHSGFNAVVKRVGHAHHPAIYGDHHHGHGGHHHGHGGSSYANHNQHSYHH